MGNLKKNIKWIVLIVLGIVISCGISVYATYNYFASDIKYTESKTVEKALDELYDKSKNYILPSGTLDITTNGNNVDIKQYEKVNVNVTVAGTKTLLWTNNNPNSAFANDTITLNSSIANYTHFLLKYKADKGSEQQYEDIFKISPERTQNGLAGNYVFGATLNNSHYSRNIWYVSSTSLKFGNANQMSNNNTVNDYLIPLYIYGLNFSY